MLLQVTAPSTTVVTLASLKVYLNINDTSWDSEFSLLLTAAQQYIENACCRSFTSTVWQELFSRTEIKDKTQNNDYWLATASVELYLQRSPVSAIGSMTYYDTSNVLTTLTTYSSFVPYQTPAHLSIPVPVTNYWDWLYDRDDALQVTYTATYGTVPPLVPLAIKMVCADWWTHRGNTVDYQLKEVPQGVDRIIEQLRCYHAA